jgi:murein DD-endopeptidase MepM/ murein hydrolase activator NlpD
MRAGRSHRRLVFVSLAVFSLGLSVWAVRELPYVNWQPIAAPVDQLPLTIRQDAKGDGRYGAPRSGNRTHRGIDLAAPLGSPVRAIRSGAVIQAAIHRGLGHYVEINHGEGVVSLYAHMKSTEVKRGERIRQGQAIGTVGKSGNARHAWIMPHVHLEVTEEGERIDPHALGLETLIVQEMPENADARGGE